MSYHADLWITTGAAAPVLLIAAFVPYFNIALARWSKVETPLNRAPVQITTYAFVMGYICILLDEFLFVVSVYSLATEQDTIPPIAVVVVTSLIMFALVSIVGVRAMSPMFAERADEISESAEDV